MTTRLNWLWVVGVMILSSVCSQAQQNATGRQAFGSFSGGPDIINLGNLDVSLDIPILHRPGRGIPFVFDLTYDSSLVWLPVTTNGATTWTPQPGWGWPVPISAVGYVPPPVVYTTGPIICGLHVTETTTWWIYSGYVDVHGTMHHVPNLMTSATSAPANCGGDKWTDASASTDDGSGYSISILHGSVSTAAVTSKGGATFTAPIGVGTATVAQDSNGNKITANASLGEFFDTLSSTTPALTVTGTSPVSYTYAAPSGSVSVVVSYKSYPVQTHFLCSTVTDYGVSSPIHNNLVDKITYPDGSFYQFAYEPTTTGSGNVTGRIKSVTLPTGGTISYVYTGSNGGINCADGTTMGFDRTTPDSATPWHYSRSGTNPNWTTTVTDPVGTVTTYNMYQVTSTTTGGSASQSTYTYYERNRTITGSLETILTCYNAVYSGCTTAALTLPFSQIDQYVTLGSETLATESKFDTANGGRVTEVRQYDFGVATGGPPSSTYLLKDTTISYAALTGIIDHPYQVTVKDGSGNTKAQTTFTYSDTVTGTIGTPQHTSPSGSRGNAITVTSLTSGSATLSKNFSYFDTGNIYQATDVNTAVTTYVYGSATTTCGNAFPTEVDLPLSLKQQSTWNCTGAVMASSIDVNGNTTTYQYTDSNYWRPTNIIFPDSASDTESISYDTGSTFPWKITTTKAVDPSNSETTINWIDSLGRTYSVYGSDPNSSNSYNHIWITFDALGRKYTVTNPYFTSSDPTYGSTTYNYDPLSRVTKITNPDGTYRTFSYTDRDTDFTDESGIRKVYQMDGLGRLQRVCDGIGAGTQADGISPSSCGMDIIVTGFPIAYTYDPMGNLTWMSLNGQTRTFAYDGLSRLISEINPETGTTTYVYDTATAGDIYSKTTPAPNQTSPCVGTIATCNTLTYEFDTLHRLKEVFNSSGIGVAAYVYDETSPPTGWPSTTLHNTKGRVSWTSVTAGWDAVYSYDAMGRMASEWSCTPDICGTSTRNMAYTYDYIGQPTTTVMNGNYTITYGRNAIGQLTGVTSSLSDSTHPATLYSGATYNPFGRLASGTYGDNNGTGTVRTNTYDKLGRLTEIQDGSTPTYRLFLGYYADSTVSSYQDNVTGLWNYTYDAFNRLATAALTQTGNPNAPSYSYSYDRLGNRWKQHRTAGTGYEVDYTFDGNNHNTTSGFAYDAAGNLTSDGTCTPCWTYDWAGNVVSDNGGATFSYDGSGRRVARTYGGTTYDFLLDPSGVPIAEYEGSTPSRFTGGFFTYANNTTYFNRTDNLGTSRLTTDYTGAVQRTEGVLMGPFGDGFSETGSQFVDFAGFAGGMWDSENNSDHFGAREYAKTQGRWLTPDPAGLAVVNPTDPQTWNRYAYVNNNPTTFIDPSGLVDIMAAMAFFAGGGGGLFGMCTQDAVMSNCQTNAFLVGGGAATLCPTGACVPTMVQVSNGGTLYLQPGGSSGQWGGCGSVTGGDGQYQMYCSYWFPAGGSDLSALGGSSQPNIYYLQAKVFLTGLARNAVSEFQSGGCVAQFFGELSPAGTISGQDAAIDSTAQAAAYVSASAYAAEAGLTVPMRSSVVRGILNAGEVGGAAVALGLTIADELGALKNELVSYANGECQ
jgi:RHS repeat-associated protein